jgi:hypothetical protein
MTVLLHSLIAPVSIKDALLSSIQLISSIYAGYFYLKVLHDLGPKYVYKVMLFLAILILLGSALELLNTPVKQMSELFRFNYYGSMNTGLNYRALIHYGGARPYFFTSEPSHIAKYFITIFMIIYSTSPRKAKNVILLLTLYIFSVIIIRSPLLLIIIALIVGYEYFIAKSLKISGKISSVFLIGMIIFISTIYMGNRFDSIQTGRDVSYFIRIGSLDEILLKTLKEYPLFGVGIGGKTIMESIVTDVYYDFGMMHSSIEGGNAERIANYLVVLILYFGLITSTVIFYLFYKILKISYIPNWYFLMFSVLAYSFSEGGMVTARVWVYIYSIVYISHVKSTWKELSH